MPRVPPRQSWPYSVGIQLAELSEAAEPCALQNKGAATNCYGYAPVLLRSARAIYGWGSEEQPKRKASMCLLGMS